MRVVVVVVVVIVVVVVVVVVIVVDFTAAARLRVDCCPIEYRRGDFGIWFAPIVDAQRHSVGCTTYFCSS